MILAAASEPEVELLHVFERDLVVQIVVGFARRIEAGRLMPGLIYPLLLQLTLLLCGLLLRVGTLAQTILSGLGQDLAALLGTILDKLVEGTRYKIRLASKKVLCRKARRSA